MVSHSPWDAEGFTGKQQFVPTPWGHYCPCFADEQRFAGTDLPAQSQRALVRGPHQDSNLALDDFEVSPASL